MPELLPKGMKWKDVLAYLKKHPDHTPFFNLEFLATHAVLTGVRFLILSVVFIVVFLGSLAIVPALKNAEMADAYMWIYGGQTVLHLSRHL